MMGLLKQVMKPKKEIRDLEEGVQGLHEKKAEIRRRWEEDIRDFEQEAIEKIEELEKSMAPKKRKFEDIVSTIYI